MTLRKDFWGGKPTFGATSTFEAKPLAAGGDALSVSESLHSSERAGVPQLSKHALRHLFQTLSLEQLQFHSPAGFSSSATERVLMFRRSMPMLHPWRRSISQLCVSCQLKASSVL